MRRVLVAMSGGVDSAVAACLLIKAGYEVDGATMVLCGNNTDDARSVCDALGIRHYVFDFSEQFRRRVVDRFVGCYKAGGTPNPCVECNRYIKFGEFMARAELLGYDGIATGHYAVTDTQHGRWLLKKARDRLKDQSYFLYTLTQAQLRRTLFPLGGLTKAEVRRLAAENGFVNHAKPDSQDICFIADGDYRGFIERYTGDTGRPGDFTDADGRVLGRHGGIANYTIGQRKGLGVALGRPVFVCAKDASANTVVLGERERLYSTRLLTTDVNLISVARLDAPMRATVRIRYNGGEAPAVLQQVSGSEVRVEFDSAERAVTEGQAAVFYDGDTVIGGGTIAGAV